MATAESAAAEPVNLCRPSACGIHFPDKTAVLSAGGSGVFEMIRQPLHPPVALLSTPHTSPSTVAMVTVWQG